MTTARKIAASNKPRDEVEAALKVYKSRVAEKVQYYRDNDDLCDDEYQSIREDLDLEEFLPADKELMVKISGPFKAKFDVPLPAGYYPDNQQFAEAIAVALADVLENGLKSEVRSFRGGVPQKIPATITFTDPDLEDYDLTDQ